MTSGSLLVDGLDVRELDLASYRQQLGVVPQEPYLFPGTIRDAIAYGRPDATDAEVEAAARGVGAIEMIASCREASCMKCRNGGGTCRPGSAS